MLHNWNSTSRKVAEEKEKIKKVVERKCSNIVFTRGFFFIYYMNFTKFRFNKNLEILRKIQSSTKRTFIEIYKDDHIIDYDN
jgi:hypothetical protein